MESELSKWDNWADGVNKRMDPVAVVPAPPAGDQ